MIFLNPYTTQKGPLYRKYAKRKAEIVSNTPEKPKFVRIDPDMPRFKPIEYDERVIDSDEVQEEDGFEDESDEFQEEEEIETEEF